MQKNHRVLSLRKLIQLSRPRFRLYVLGPFVIAWIAWFTQWGKGIDHARELISIAYQNPWISIYTLVAVLYFSFSANLLIYWVNDYADRDTDQHNQKKSSYETATSPEYRPKLKRSLLYRMIPSTIALMATILWWGFMNVWSLLIALGWFFFFAIFYSLPPIRAKARPFIDSIFNILYQFSALFGWVIAGHALTDYSIWAWIGWWLWMMARHTFSAIPDIEPDSIAGIETTAIYLWEKKSLLYCATLWLLAFLCFFPLISRRILLGIIVFCGFCASAYLINDTYRIYKIIPWIIPFLWTAYFRILLLFV